MEIIDNAISEFDLKAIQNQMLTTKFPWHFNPQTVKASMGKDDINDFQFGHSFYFGGARYGSVNSKFFPIIEPILDRLKTRVLIRVKANLRTVAPQYGMMNGWHHDTDLKSETAIFYVNTNNGHTIFKESQEKVESVANRLVIFPTELEHCGVSCTDKKQRVVINFNFIR